MTCLDASPERSVSQSSGAITASAPASLARPCAGIREAVRGFPALLEAAATGRTLERRTKRRIAMAHPATLRCDPCVGYHAETLVSLVTGGAVLSRGALRHIPLGSQGGGGGSGCGCGLDRGSTLDRSRAACPRVVQAIVSAVSRRRGDARGARRRRAVVTSDARTGSRCRGLAGKHDRGPTHDRLERRWRPGCPDSIAVIVRWRPQRDPAGVAAAADPHQAASARPVAWPVPRADARLERLPHRHLGCGGS